jgi:hypothetical protein
MKRTAYLIVVAMQFMYMIGCQSMPLVTRTGDMKEVLVKDNLSPAELSVNAGDEVRWTNKHIAPIQIVFFEPVHNKISCRNNFSGFFTGGIEATLGPNESASLCFRESTYAQYVVRMKSALPGGEVNISGAIRVGRTLGQPSAQELPCTMHAYR